MDEKGIQTENLGRKKYRIHLLPGHFDSLNEISRKTQIPMGRLIDLAIDGWLFSLDIQQENPSVTPREREDMIKYIRKCLGMDD